MWTFVYRCNLLTVAQFHIVHLIELNVIEQ